MARIWSRPLGVTDLTGPDYWDYFAARLVERTAIYPGLQLLDVGCGTGSSLFPAAEKTSPIGYAIGIDICPN
jgi:O-methyltransferase/aklanonic acid methyltransferase